MITISKFVLLVSMLLTILVALQFKDGKSLSTELARVTVHVTNNLNDLQLGDDCKDKNRDFGFQTLKVGESYTFQFKPLFFLPKSLYFCSFSWINGNHRFDILVITTLSILYLLLLVSTHCYVILCLTSVIDMSMLESTFSLTARACKICLIYKGICYVHLLLFLLE